jgi:photosystem II stability/assembly factor-like uncharacterized protein
MMSSRMSCGAVFKIILAVIVVISFPLCVSAEKKIKHEDLFSVTFPTENDGWACGRWGTILHTDDGGKTWKQQVTGIVDQFNSISFADTKHGWAVGDAGVIVNTSDGGKTWQKQISPTNKPILLGVHFVNAQKGWAVGEYTHILHTKDGGKTWQVQFKDEQWTLHSVSFCDENVGWAVGEYGYIYQTNDGGTTWKKQAGKFGIDPETGEIMGGNYLFSVVSINPQTAVAVGIDGIVIKTVDGGATWQKANTDLPQIHLFGVTARNGQLFIAARGNLMTGPESGGRFEPVKLEPSIPYGYIYGITRRGKAGFVAVGKEGRIYLSDDKPTGAWRLVGY